ncbi:lytic transglycosylase domain-containing protein [Taibaiella koreensis]|uniref:lytic transglycosylase domain-containing protein n=1 Tax=Taibaiella koreensis TaxID=1268548 RepID=UPI0013C3464D|nr:lytic transglycosylase domain-containing protein [Taibaiella koreensis]
MQTLRKTALLLLISLLSVTGAQAGPHEVIFCGERIPVDNNFVASRLMNVIRKQVPVVNLPRLRQQANAWFPVFERYLARHGLPMDLKYIPVVESGFANATSHAGAAGYWQLMPETARGLGLKVDDIVDERNDIAKSTDAACRLLKSYYTSIGVWALTLAGYNFGIGNISKAIKQQGSNYFSMQLNPETAVYVYKIIAVKELFEYPELYMKDFGYNVFNADARPVNARGGSDNDEEFKTMSVKVMSKTAKTPKVKLSYYSAHIENARKFSDGDLVKIVFDEDIYTSSGLSKKGYGFKATGWLIDGRVFIDLNMGHELTVLAMDNQKGIPLSEIKSNKKTEVILKQEEQADN